MKRVCIHQPDFLPYLGFFHRLCYVDILIVLDDVQFSRRGWHHRDLIKTRYGPQWLTLSIQKGDYNQNINEVRLSKNRKRWTAKHLNLFKENYRQAPYFDDYYPKIEKIYLVDYEKMLDLNQAFLNLFFEMFDIEITCVLSSTLDAKGTRNHKLINLVNMVSGTNYLSGNGAKNYLDVGMFDDEGIIVEWQNFKHPIYPQLHGEFVPNLSCIDLLFNCGPNSKEVLRSCLKT